MIGTFSPSDSALLLIDHQLGTMKLIKNIPFEVVKRNTLALAKTAKILNIPVILTSSQEQNVQGPLLPELEQILPEAFASRVRRAGIVNAWNDPNFKKAVEATGRRNLIMAGVTTDVCVESTARDAFMRDYHVVLLSDCTGVDDPVAQQSALERIDRYFGHVVSSEEVVNAWNRLRARKPQGLDRGKNSARKD